MDLTLASENFARWATALLTQNPENVASLYTENLTLLPTMANKVIVDRAGAIEYFTFFGSFQPSVKMVEEHMIEISADSYVHCGVYRFTLHTNGSPEDMDARFTMVWKKGNDEWKILHHHSSRVPGAV